MSPPPDGVNAQSRWPCGTATHTYSLYGYVNQNIIVFLRVNFNLSSPAIYYISKNDTKSKHVDSSVFRQNNLQKHMPGIFICAATQLNMLKCKWWYDNVCAFFSQFVFLCHLFLLYTLFLCYTSIQINFLLNLKCGWFLCIRWFYISLKYKSTRALV